MMTEGLFTVYVLDGDFREWMEIPDMPYLRYSGLSAEKLLILAQTSLQCGFQVVVLSEGAGDDQA